MLINKMISIVIKNNTMQSYSLFDIIANNNNLR